MFGALGGLTSLTGGGDLGELSGDATSGVGDTSMGGKQVGGVNFGAKQPTSPAVILVVIIAVIAVAYIVKK